MAHNLIVGLGNFRDHYQNTPHNIGFHGVEALARRWNLPWKKTAGGYSQAEPLGLPHQTLLVKPHSYMNTSGPVVQRAQIQTFTPLEQLIIVCDDFALPWGRLRLRRKGSSGGHRGLESVIESLGSENFTRLRVGVGPVPEGTSPEDFVLKRQPEKRIENLAAKAADALETVVSEGLEAAMNKFNARIEMEDK